MLCFWAAPWPPADSALHACPPCLFCLAPPDAKLTLPTHSALPCSFPEGGLTSGESLTAAVGKNCARLDPRYTAASAPSPGSAPAPAPTPASAATALARTTPAVLGALVAVVAGAVVLLG